MKKVLLPLPARKWNVEKAAKKQAALNARKAVWVAVLNKWEAAK
jgi:hypothetical protein